MILYTRKTLLLLLIVFITVGAYQIHSLFSEDETTAFCDSASIEEGSDFPPTCYEVPKSWKEEGKIYSVEKLEVKK
jgi:hypothetical protein